ncbi:MAG: pyridoxamine 5'-phosphate oxidase family protein [Dermatophilaceae bacterium]
MRLGEADARRRLAAYDHGVLATVHPVRGVDAVPVAYAVDGDLVGIPVDTVKPKTSGPLQRERNLAADPRAALLVDHWDPADWTRLWWVRAQLRWAGTGPAAEETALAEALERRYPQYHDRPFARVLVFRLRSVTGWSGQVP